MALVLSHAMFRPLSSPPDGNYSSYHLRSEGCSSVGDVTKGGLSRSMRYADPWLYGSVRLTPALVLCQCSDYLTGSRRSSSKKSPYLCKKCKGTRLPLGSVDKFGTVRCYPTSAPVQASPLRAGTVRVTSSSRPSILPTSDPYDLMRRSRLSVPETTSTTSPFRDVAAKRSSSASRVTSSGSTFSPTRRSILECDVNPYDLMEPKNVMVNGQRIRLRAGNEYEDVQVKTKKKVTLKLTGTTGKPKKPSNNSTYKSILKKGGSNYNSDSSPYSDVEETVSPLTSRRSGTKFYIPAPLTPRKKVQFLDDGKEVSPPLENEVFEEPSPSPPEVRPQVKIHRSNSDRISKQEPKNVDFFDTMALRNRKRSDSRIVFDKKDMEKLDGIGERVRKMSPRPLEPPPPPPPPPPCTDKEDSAPDTSPPLAPPRKRSGGKQPVQIKVEPVPEPTNKTIVQITSPSPVHKIQIKNESPLLDTSVAIFETHRKTSILIGGDDCYSTVNVNDDVPLYQSSVVVNDDGGSVQVNTLNNSSRIYITPVVADPADLQTLLKDPVEAIRHNLVPHVCGKSDVERRLRDTKFPNHTKPLGGGEEILEDVPQTVEQGFKDLEDDSSQYELMDGSECYSNRSSVTEEELANRTKFYELLSSGSCNIEVSEGDDHHYESIKVNNNNTDPIYEEIELPPPLPSNPPPSMILDDLHLDKEYTTRSIFEGASKYDILSYLVDAKERGVIQEEGYTYPFPSNNDDAKDSYNRSHMSTVSDSSEDNSLIIGALIDEKATLKPAEVERNDSGVGSETSKSSLSKYRLKPESFANCEDCDSSLDGKGESEALLCRKCLKRRSERKEIITEIVETEEKYSRDLQIILEEFYQPMLVAGLLTPDQLSAIFLNVEELLENSQALAERLRDALEIAVDQGDDDYFTVNIGKLFLEASPMLHAFETYCVRQGTASLLLASLEKEKELLRIFLRVSQMENTMLRRMNLNSFLMVPVQRVTKYPLLLARLYKVTPTHHEIRDQLKEAQHKIELHLNHMNSETKDVPSKLWRRIGSNNGRRSSTEMDLVNIKLRKIAVDVLEWNHDEARFILEGKLLFTQPTDNNWRKGRTIKLTPVNALLVINGKNPCKLPQDKIEDQSLMFSPKNSGVREAALLLVRDKNGRYSLLREPLYLDRCVIAADPAWQSYFEVQELLNKDTFIFKAEDEDQTHLWYRKLQCHAQGMGQWRKRRNALANIMINGMGLRT